MSTTLSKPPFDLQKIRADFPILGSRVNGEPLIYLDNGATSQRPSAVIEAEAAFYRESNANIHRGVHALSQKATAMYDEARRKVKIWLNAASDDEIVFTKGNTESINLVAATYGRANLKPGDVIVLSVMEHHSNIVPWQLVAEQTGAKIEVVPMDDAGVLDLAAYEQILAAQPVKIVALVHVSNALGTVNPIADFARLAHAHGAVILVDGAQGAPHLPIDVQALDADFYTVSVHKAYGPTGVGVLYGRKALLDAMPPYQGGGDMIRTVSFEKTTYAEVPAKFEAGTPNIAGVVALGAAVDYLASLGSGASLRERLVDTMGRISAQERLAARRAEVGLREIPGLRITGNAPDKGGIVAFTLEAAHPHDIGTVLDMDGIAIRAGHHCCQPLMRRLGVPATARASFTFYNTEEEADALVSAVRKVVEMFS